VLVWCHLKKHKEKPG